MGDASLVFQWVGSALSSIWTTLYSGAGWLGTFIIAAAVIRFCWKYIIKVIIK